MHVKTCLKEIVTSYSLVKEISKFLQHIFIFLFLQTWFPFSELEGLESKKAAFAQWPNHLALVFVLRKADRAINASNWVASGNESALELNSK